MIAALEDRAAEINRESESDMPEEQARLRARYRQDPKTGDLVLRDMWKEERRLMEDCRKAAREIGVGANHPAIALQVNNNGQLANADEGRALLGPHREASRIIDATSSAPATVIARPHPVGAGQ